MVFTDIPLVVFIHWVSVVLFSEIVKEVFRMNMQSKIEMNVFLLQCPMIHTWSTTAWIWSSPMICVSIATCQPLQTLVQCSCPQRAFWTPLSTSATWRLREWFRIMWLIWKMTLVSSQTLDWRWDLFYYFVCCLNLFESFKFFVN